MTNKTKILIGLGALAVVGVGVYLWKKKKTASKGLIEKSGDPAQEPIELTPTSTPTPPIQTGIKYDTKGSCKYMGKFIRGDGEKIVYWVSGRANGQCVKVHWSAKTKDGDYAWAKAVIVPKNEVYKIEKG